MRKLISIGLIGLLFLLLAETALAGNVDDCEYLKGDIYSKGLYGLCIAYWSADDANARSRIGDNFKKKATGPNDPLEVPGGAACPCWTDTDLAYAVSVWIPTLCLEDESDVGLEFAWYNGASIQFFVNGFGELPFCGNLNPPDPSDPFIDLNDATDAACREDIYELIQLSFGGVCGL